MVQVPLPAAPLAELGLLQARIQSSIETHLHPKRLYIGRFGHTLFVWREFCERPDPPPVEGPSVERVIAMLRGT
jgi:hypothetical protein